MAGGRASIAGNGLSCVFGSAGAGAGGVISGTGGAAGIAGAGGVGKPGGGGKGMPGGGGAGIGGRPGGAGNLLPIFFFLPSPILCTSY
ncbi:MAG: hypothetical protein DWC02_06070 [Candidatus Poseidoniales archaeon]|nr:MAG: hypothetical protein DWC02_06070 [Candidatus Poseidoniales archaeon]